MRICAAAFDVDEESEPEPDSGSVLAAVSLAVRFQSAKNSMKIFVALMYVFLFPVGHL